MKKILSGLMAMATVAIMTVSACSGAGKSDSKATDTTDASVEMSEESEADASTSGEAVVEIPAGTANLDQYNGRLTVVDFNAVWCGPCRQYAPTFHAVARKMAGKADFLSVNVDSCRSIADKYVGQFIPQTTVITPDGRFFSKTGQLDEATLVAFIDSVAAL